MRIRTIKPELYQSETMATVPREVRDLAKALITWSDDEGYFRSHPRLIAGALYPFDGDGPEFVERGLTALSGIGFIQLFEGGVGFLPGFETNQRINRASPSKLKPKALIILEPAVSAPPQLTEPSVSPHARKGMEGNGSGTGKEVERAKKPRTPSQQEVWFAEAQAVRVARRPGITADSVGVVELNSALKGPLAKVGAVGLTLAWEAFLADPWAAERGWPWPVFVSQWPQHHAKALAVKSRPTADLGIIPSSQGYVRAAQREAIDIPPEMEIPL